MMIMLLFILIKLLKRSRLYVKNLPKYVTEQRVKDHFAQKGEVTDVKIIRNKNTGESRQFGFVGFRTEKQAKEALKFFNNAYLDTRKLEVSIAKTVGDSALPKPWSRHSKGSKAYKRAHPEENDESEQPLKKKQKISDQEETNSNSTDFDSQKQYFMNLVKSSNGQLWRDDNLIPEQKKLTKKKMKDGTKAKIEESYVKSKKTGGEGVFYEKKRIVFADSDEDSDNEEEYQDLPLNEENNENDDNDMEDEDGNLDSVANNDALSDMDYLRSKMISKEKLEVEHESDSEDIEESESDVDEENKDNEEVEENDNKDENTENEEQETEKEEEKKDLFNDDDNEEDIGESGRLFVRNLPFSTIEEDLVSHFSRYGELSEVHLPVDPETKLGKGFAFVQFQIPANAAVAFDNLDNTIFQGRLIHILPAKSMTQVQENAKLSADAKSSFKKKKEMKAKEISNDDTNWNTIFLRVSHFFKVKNSIFY